MSEISTTQTALVEKTNACETNSTAMELILERALQSDVDLDRLKSLLELREKEIKRQERQNFVHDLSTMQMEYKEIQKNATNPHTNSQYATLDKYLDAIKDSLSKYRFSLFSRIKEQNSNGITVEMTLKHISGNEISTQGTFPFDATGSKNNIQAVGSTITYARRYLLGMLLNVASKEDDTDGNPPIKKAFPQQINEIRRLIVQTQSEEAKVLDYVKVKNLTDMSEGQAQIVLHLLKDKQNKQKALKEQSLPQQEQTNASIQDAEYIHIQDIEYAPTQQEKQTAV
ncbi:ERF family protein [Bartonella florencae]|uniref:ERF family protein n=1 Tax=Bartonella florencae TaxID=928210 RepID=UPI0005611DFF|nr:ERF family protein [Bartonella florencae]